MKLISKRITLILGILLSTEISFAGEKTPAFPGAEGFGRYVTGGRGGKVYHVTNLEDTGTGSLRWALNQSGTKTIVFDVSGTIHLKSALSIESNTTIAGQTAPGDGICVADYPCTIKGNNVIVRYMRFRLGNKNVLKDGADGWDGFGGFDQKDWMIDHCSVSWSIDECLSVLGNKNTTVQWCLVAQSLVNSGHSKGAHGYGGNWGGSGASFHHNLIAHHTSRTPRLGPRPTTQLDERMDMRNNVIYNFGSNGCYGGEGMTVNIVNNYYKPGPGSPTDNKGKRIAGIGIRTNEYVKTYPAYAPALHLWGKYYVTGNVNSKYSDVTKNNWTIGIINQIDANGCDGTFTQATKDSIKLEEPMKFVYTTTHTAAQAYEKVLDFVGASKSRDTFDEMIIADTREGKASHTGTGLSRGFVNSQDDNKPAGAGDDWDAWPTLNSTAAPTDTDGDGMPDDWETANGLNPNDAFDGTVINEEGYTNLEMYLNSLVADITAAQYEGGTVEGYIEETTVNEDGSEEGKQTVATGTVNWGLHNGATDETAEYSTEISNMIGENQITLGKSLAIAASKTRKINNITFTQIQPSNNNEATANDENAVCFKFSVKDGYFFRPTQIGFLASRIGTDGGAIDVNWQNGNGTSEIDNLITPDRNNGTPGYTTYNKTVSNIASASGSSTLKIHIYKLGNSKQIALANISITGELKRITADGIVTVQTVTIQADKVYDLQGRQVASPTKGLYILNGKKYILK